MPIPREDSLARGLGGRAREPLPARTIREEKLVEGRAISAHANEHATGGDDPLTLGSIGAASSGHIHRPLHNLAATAAPAVTDDEGDGYGVGSYWFDVTNDKAYACLDATEGAAVWQRLDGYETRDFIIDGGGSAITTGIKGDKIIDFDCQIMSWTILPDQSGSIVIDIWKDSYANFPPTDADSMCDGKEPTLTATTKAQDTDVTDWTTDDIAAGDCLRFNVDSADTVERVTLSLKLRRT